MEFLRASDTLGGNEGRATAIIDGQVENLFYVKKVEANIDKRKSEVRSVGERATQHATRGWGGTGSFTIYYMTSLFRKLILQYIKTGRDVYFTLTVTNDDAGSTVGKQTSVLYDCNIDNTTIALLDIDADTLEEDMEFTFSGVDLLDEFGRPIG